MKERLFNSAYPKIEYYLYNYQKLNNRINDINTQILNLNYNHFNYGKWIKAKVNCGNSLENQIVNKINNEAIITKLNIWKTLIEMILIKFKRTDKLKYKYIHFRYFNKLSAKEIEQKLNIDKYKQRDIRAEILHYIFLICVKRNILKEVKQEMIQRKENLDENL